MSECVALAHGTRARRNDWAKKKKRSDRRVRGIVALCLSIPIDSGRGGERRYHFLFINSRNFPGIPSSRILAHPAHGTKTNRKQIARFTFSPFFSPHCFGATGSFLRANSPKRRYPGARYGVLAVTFCHCQRLGFAPHHFIIDTPPNLFLSLVFYHLFTVSTFPTIPPFLSLLLSRTHTHALFRFLSLLTVENTRILPPAGTVANPIASETNRTRGPSVLPLGLRRTSERVSRRERNPQPRGRRAKRSARLLSPYDHPWLSLAIPNARDACYSPLPLLLLLLFLFLFLYIYLYPFYRGNRVVL